MTELRLPRSEPQLSDTLSRTSVPVITIKRSSESRSVPTTTTIVLQPSSVQSNIGQRDEEHSAHTQPGMALHSHLVRNGSEELGRLHVLKSKNGRSNASSLLVTSKPPSPVTTTLPPSCTVREVQNGQQSASPPKEAAGSALVIGLSVQVLPKRAKSPPLSGTAPSTITTSSSLKYEAHHADLHDGDTAPRQVHFSPFQADEAQLHERQQLESRHSNSDSDKSAESAGMKALLHLVVQCFLDAASLHSQCN